MSMELKDVEYKVIELNSCYAICHKNTLVDISCKKTGGLYKSEKTAIASLKAFLERELRRGNK